MASIVQTSGKVARTGLGLTSTITMPGNFVPGNWVIVTIAAESTFAGLSVGGVTWAGGEVEDYPYGGLYYAIVHQVAPAGTRNDVVITFGSGAANRFTASVEEWSGLTATDQVGLSASGNATVTTTSPSTTQASEVVYAIGLNQSLSGGVATHGLAGYTTTMDENGATAINCRAGYKTVASTGAQSATYTSSDSDNIAVALATYKATGGGGGAAISQRNGIALSGLSQIDGITKSGISAINALTI